MIDMIDGKKTPLEIQREEQVKYIIDDYMFIVTNTDGDHIIKTPFGTLEEVLHKVKLDILTSIRHGGTIEINVDRKR